MLDLACPTQATLTEANGQTLVAQKNVAWWANPSQANLGAHGVLRRVVVCLLSVSVSLCLCVSALRQTGCVKPWSQTRIFGVHVLEPPRPQFHEKTQQRERRSEILGGPGEGRSGKEGVLGKTTEKTHKKEKKGKMKKAKTGFRV